MSPHSDSVSHKIWTETGHVEFHDTALIQITLHDRFPFGRVLLLIPSVSLQ